MIHQTINKDNLLEMVQAGANNLAQKRETINRLNVFPVPDGDTGTNMNLSMTSGVNEMKKEPEASLQEQLNHFTRGLLMGARGNSGVILSQLFRGFSSIKLENDLLEINTFTDALNKGVEIAYQSVTNPVEGTILTVAKDMAKKATEIMDEVEDFISYMEKVVAEGKASLERTPDLLPVLKEVGVVDSGGKGFLTIYEGFLAFLKGEEIASLDELSFEALVEDEHEEVIQSIESVDEIEYGYCTEFFVQLEDEKENFDEEEFRTLLAEHGDSLLVASDGNLVKVHVHSEYPGGVLTLAQRFGSLMNIDIENMREQYKDRLKEKEEVAELPIGKFSVITVAQGEGLKNMFRSIGATEIIDGGQTMNPSTEDFLQLIEKQTTEHTFILPNNKNILLSANQAVELTNRSVSVIPTVTIPQGIQALFEFNQDEAVDDNIEHMKEALSEVKTGLVTYATRDTKINDIMMRENDYIGLNDETIVVANTNRLQTVISLIEELLDEDDEIVTIFYGEDVRNDEVEILEAIIEEEFSDIEVEVHVGNQPIYSYILMVE